jgi:hypothetical protein
MFEVLTTKDVTFIFNCDNEGKFDSIAVTKCCIRFLAGSESDVLGVRTWNRMLTFISVL